VLRFVIRRLLLLVPILLGLSILVFAWIRALPGGPAEALLGERLTPESRAQIEEQYGLDDPLFVQYWRYFKTTVVDRDLGTSINTRRPVSDELKERFPATIELAVAAMLFAMVLGIPLGYFAAKKYGGTFDQASLLISLLGVSIPIFFLAILLKYVFAIKLGLLPTVGRMSVLIDIDHPTNFYVLDAIIAGDPEALWDVIKHLILPAIALGSIPLAIVARITRAATLDVQNEDYVRTARAKGLAEAHVMLRHALPNALIPVITISGLALANLITGSFFIEAIYGVPGIGRYFVTTISDKDYPVLMAVTLLYAALIWLVNFLADICYAMIDPRIRLSS